jgi:acetyltransferase-like isoleucine patch superfamily enzyme
MSQLGFKITLFCKCRNLLDSFISWFIFFKYALFITYEGRFTLGRGVKIKQFSFRETPLCVVFRGGNKIGNDTIIQGSGKISFGKGTFCGERCVFGVNNAIEIGNHVMIAQHVTIRDTDHGFANLKIPMVKQEITIQKVVIEDDVWIAHGACILKGVTIGKGAIIAANAVVTKDVQPFSI